MDRTSIQGIPSFKEIGEQLDKDLERAAVIGVCGDPEIAARALTSATYLMFHVNILASILIRAYRLGRDGEPLPYTTIADMAEALVTTGAVSVPSKKALM